MTNIVPTHKQDLANDIIDFLANRKETVADSVSAIVIILATLLNQLPATYKQETNRTKYDVAETIKQNIITYLNQFDKEQTTKLN